MTKVTVAFRDLPKAPFVLVPFHIPSLLLKFAVHPPSSSVEQGAYKKCDARHNSTAHSSSAYEMKNRRPEDTIFFF